MSCSRCLRHGAQCPIVDILFSRAVGDTRSAITGQQAGVLAHSPYQVAVAVTTLTAATGNPGTIALGAGLKCFDLLSYFGCILPTVGGQVTAAGPCDISVSGYRGKTMVGEQAFSFGQPVSYFLSSLLCRYS